MLNFYDLTNEQRALSDAQLATELPNLSLTPMKVGLLIIWLRDNSLAKLSANNSFKGMLPNFIEDDTIDSALRDGVDDFLGYLITPNADVFHCNVRSIANQAGAVMGGLLTYGIVVKSQVDEFYSIGGGQPYKGITEAQVTDARDTYNTLEAERIAQEKFEVVVAHVINEYINTATDNTSLIAKLDEAKTYVESL